MDFLRTATLLMTLQEKAPLMRYSFEGNELTITVPVHDGVAEDFDRATKLFEPL